ncbi:MAG TPA: hypothetical protein VIL37_15110 [Natronosporangium sp.]
MPLREELAPKVAEIERLAREMYDLRLGAYGLKVENGVVMNDPDRPAPMHYVDQAEEQRNYDNFVSYLDTVTSRFELYYDLDDMELLDLTAKIGGLADYPGYGNPYTVFDRIDHADDHWMRPVLGMIDAEEWSGNAATTFYNDFLLPFHDAAEQQQACTRVLGMVAMCGYKGVIKAQDDLLAIADAAIAAFSGEGREADWAGLLTVASLISGAVGLFLTGNPAIAAGVVSLGTSIGSMFAATDDSGDERRVEIKALNAPMGLESLWDALMAFEDELERKDRQMAEPLENDLNSSQCFASAGLRLPEPGIDSPDDFGTHQVGTVVDGVPVGERESVVTAVALYEAGSRNLPSAAYQLDTAASHLTETVPWSFRKLFPQTASTFQQCRAKVRSAISAIASDLEDTGAILIDVAKNYEATEEENAEILRQIEMVLPPVTSEPNYPPYY